MSKQNSRIQHVGIVEDVTETSICVSIVSTSACSSCHAKGGCSMSEQVEKKVRIPNTGIPVTKGETVNVVMSTSTGFKSVFLAYILPIVLLILSVAVFTSLSLSEGVSALLTLVVIAIYYGVLFLLRKVLESKFEMRIEKF